jgi:hypothetical protein
VRAFDLIDQRQELTRFRYCVTPLSIMPPTDWRRHERGQLHLCLRVGVPNQTKFLLAQWGSPLHARVSRVGRSFRCQWLNRTPDPSPTAPRRRWRPSVPDVAKGPIPTSRSDRHNPTKPNLTTYGVRHPGTEVGNRALAYEANKSRTRHSCCSNAPPRLSC